MKIVHTNHEVNNMNKVGKTVMYMMGGAMIAAGSYYMGLPKSKKNQFKDEVSKVMKKEKNMLEDFYE